MGKYAPKLYKDRINRSVALEKQEHKDVVIRHVLTCVGGKWSKYENLLKAKTILLPEHHNMIYVNAEDLQRCPKQYYSSVMKDFGLDTMEELWDHLWNVSHDPYNTVQRFQEQDANPSLQPVKKRNRRKLAYKFFFDDTDERQMAIYYGLPPQARAIIDIVDNESKRILADNPGKAVIFEEVELMELIEREKDQLDTRQSSWRIFQYYRGKLIQYSFLRYAR